mmetsp:Transcript_86128/g.223852  ORF Transcript_86128/g.223852 Transcript_86128/m.223852 type:complete len:399 (-) Transcript_86128:53-1249(-)
MADEVVAVDGPGAGEEVPQVVVVEPKRIDIPAESDPALQRPLEIAIKQKGVKEVLDLVQRGAPLLAKYDLDFMGKDVGIALDLMVMHKRSDLALQLLRSDGSLGGKLAAASKRALALAARDGKAQVVEELLLRRAAPVQRDIEGRSALRLAASRGHGACVKALLEAGAWNQEPEQAEVTRLVQHFKLGPALGEVGAEVLPQLAEEEVARLAEAQAVAEAAKHAEADEAAAAATAAEEERTALQTRLQFAIMKQGVKEVKALVAKGAPLVATYDLDEVGRATGTALDLALLHRRYDLALHLLSLPEGVGKDLALKSPRALVWAARDGRLQILQELLAFGADATQKDEKGRSALHSAAMRGHVPCVNALLEAGALQDEPLPGEVQGYLEKWDLASPARAA